MFFALKLGIDTRRYMYCSWIDTFFVSLRRRAEVTNKNKYDEVEINIFRMCQIYLR